VKIHQIKNIFPDIDAARYNLAVWQNPNADSLFLIGREVSRAAKLGQPDTGKLKFFEVNEDGNIVKEKIIWKPVHTALSLEDPRALALPNDKLLIGLTAVLRNKRGGPVPFPAIIKINSLKTWKHELPPLFIIDKFGPGKNVTPIDSHTYLFRPDSKKYNHKLLVFSLYSKVAKKLSDINFPTDLPWASWRIGTTMPPIWLNDREALFIIHGIQLQEIDGIMKYVYSIGRAKLTKNKNRYLVEIAPDPILTPDDFLDKNGKALVQELHPDIRRVVYSCGGVIKKNSGDKLSIYVNVGDRTTFEVEFLLSELKEGLF
jgi:predicted GH43/DUF377 family glycosyl hydrolase